MKNKNNVLTVGGAAQDIFLNYQDPEIKTIQEKTYILLEEGSKIDIQKLNYYTGGGAINSAFSFSKLGFYVSTFCKIGLDNYGKFIIKELKKGNISTENITYSQTLQTALSFVISPPSKDRVILAFRGANIDLKEEEIPVTAIKAANQIYITSLSGNSAKLLLPITTLAKKNNIPVAVNPGLKQIKFGTKLLIDSLKNIDIFILNSSEAQELLISLLENNLINKQKTQKNPPEKINSGKLLNLFMTYKNHNFTINDYFKAIMDKGPSVVVVTNGAEGVYVANKEFIYFHPSIKPERIINTLGAGDSFGSTFVACLSMGKSIEDSLILGILNASCVISHEGAKTGLLTLKELEDNAQKLNKSKIHKIAFYKLLKN